MTLFSSQGYIVRMPVGRQLLGVCLPDLLVPNGIFNFTSRLGLLTSANVRESASVQLRMMFDKKAYINVFGDNFGMMSVTGLFASGICNSRTGGEISGFESIAQYYRAHRASNYDLPLYVVIGGTFLPMVYTAFLLECSIGTADPQLQIGNFSFQLAYAISDEDEDPFVPGQIGDDSSFPEPTGPTSPGQESPGNSLL